jgi:hypothetical protein
MLWFQCFKLIVVSFLYNSYYPVCKSKRRNISGNKYRYYTVFKNRYYYVEALSDKANVEKIIFNGKNYQPCCVFATGFL